MQKRSLLIAAMFAGTMIAAGSVQAAAHAAPAGSMGAMMTKDMAQDKDGMITKEEYLKKVSSMWDKADKDKKGKVSKNDLEKVFNTMGGG